MPTIESSCLVEKFSNYTELEDWEVSLLDALQSDVRTYERGQFVHRDTDTASRLYVVHSGWFASVKELANGTRAIVEVSLPGDVVGLRDVTFPDHLSGLQCISKRAVICPFPKRQLHALFYQSVKLTETFFAIMSREHAQMVQRLITVARRDGARRIAHFIMESAVRLEGIRIDVREHFDFPVDQEDLADLTGLSSVHVSRCMSDLKNRGFIDYSRGRMHIVDREGLMAFAEFDDTFLKPDLDWLSSLDPPD